MSTSHQHAPARSPAPQSLDIGPAEAEQTAEVSELMGNAFASSQVGAAPQAPPSLLDIADETLLFATPPDSSQQCVPDEPASPAGPADAPVEASAPDAGDHNTAAPAPAASPPPPSPASLPTPPPVAAGAPAPAPHLTPPPALEERTAAAAPVVEQVRAQVEGPAVQHTSLATLQGELQTLCTSVTAQATTRAQTLGPETQTAIGTATQAITQAEGQVSTLWSGPRAQVGTAVDTPLAELQKGLEGATKAIETARTQALQQAVPSIAQAATALEAEKTRANGALGQELATARAALGPLGTRLTSEANTKAEALAKAIEAKAEAESDATKKEALATKGEAARRLGTQASGKISSQLTAARSQLDRLEPQLAARVAHTLDPRIARAKAKAAAAKDGVTRQAKRLTDQASATRTTTATSLDNARIAAEQDLDTREEDTGKALTTLQTTVSADLDAARQRAADAMSAAATGLGTSLDAQLTRVQTALWAAPTLPAAERTRLLDALRDAMTAGEQALATELDTAATGLTTALADRQRTFTDEVSKAVTDAGRAALGVATTLAKSVRAQTDRALGSMKGASTAFSAALTTELGPLEQAASAELTAGEADGKALATALRGELSSSRQSLEQDLAALVSAIDDKAAARAALPGLAALYAIDATTPDSSSPLAETTVDPQALAARAAVLLTEGLVRDAAMDAVTGLDDATAEALTGVLEAVAGTSTAEVVAATVDPEQRGQAVAMALGDSVAAAVALVEGIADRGTFDASTDPAAIEAAVTQLSGPDFEAFCAQVGDDPRLDKVMRVNASLRAQATAEGPATPTAPNAPEVGPTKAFWGNDTTQQLLAGELDPGTGIGKPGSVPTPPRYDAAGPEHSRLDAEGEVVVDGARRGGRPLQEVAEPSGDGEDDSKALRRQVAQTAKERQDAATADKNNKLEEVDYQHDAERPSQGRDKALEATDKGIRRRAAVADNIAFSRYGFTVGDKASVTVGKDAAASVNLNTSENTAGNIRYDGDTLSARADATLGGFLKLRYGGSETDKVDGPTAEHGEAHDTRYRVASETAESEDHGLGTSGMAMGVGGGSSSSESVKTERVFQSKAEAEAHKARMESDDDYRKRVESAHQHPLDDAAFPAGSKVTLSRVKGESGSVSAGAVGGETSKTSARSIEVEKLANGKLKVVLTQALLEAGSVGLTMKMGTAGKQGSKQTSRIRQYEIDPKDPKALAGYYALLASGEPNELPQQESPKTDTLALPEVGLEPQLQGEVTATSTGYDGGALGLFESGDSSTVVEGRFTDAAGNRTTTQSGSRSFHASAGLLGMQAGKHKEAHTLTSNTDANGRRTHTLSSKLEADDDGALDAAARRQSGLKNDALEHQIAGASQDEGGDITIEREVSEESLLAFADQRRGGSSTGLFEGMGTRAHAKQQLGQALARARTKEDKLAAVRGYVAALGQHAISEIEQDTGHRASNHVTSATDLDLFGPAQQRKLDAAVDRWRSQLAAGADGKALLPAIRKFKACQYGLLRRLKQGKPGVPQELLADQIARARATLERVTPLEQLASTKTIDLNPQQRSDEDLATPAPDADKDAEQRTTDTALQQMFAARQAARAARSGYRKEHFLHTRAGYTSARNQLTHLHDTYERLENEDRSLRDRWVRTGTLTDRAVRLAGDGEHRQTRRDARSAAGVYHFIAKRYAQMTATLASVRRVHEPGTYYFDNVRHRVFREDERDQ